jgi:VIT1/CCC1 family predicted Fe2+/Mn2+ transporter
MVTDRGTVITGEVMYCATHALKKSIHRLTVSSTAVVTGIALAIFGAVKGRLIGISMLKSASQTALVGGLAAGAAFYLASLFS